jgi:transposase-like protein
MKRRRWDAKTKATIVLEGLKGKPVTAICQDYHLSQAQYYQWRDQFLANAPKTFEVAQQTELKYLVENWPPEWLESRAITGGPTCQRSRRRN